MANTGRSFKGAPTTNYVDNATAMTSWGNYSSGTPVQFMTEFGTMGYRMDWLGSWNGVVRGVTIPSPGVYTFSAWIKWIGGSTNVTGGAVYISGWGGGDSATATNQTLPGQWQRISITLNCTNTSMTFYLIDWGGTYGADNSSWQVTMPQVEAGSFATPFVDGTRSNTQALIDLAGNNTLTTNSLTYASDNTFSFNGTSDYISCGNFGAFYSQGTISFWMNSATLSNYPNPFHTHFQGGNAGIRFEESVSGNNFGVVIGNDAGSYSAHVYMTTSMTANTWYHVTLTWNTSSNIATGYLNGVQVFNEAQTLWATTMPSVTIGNGFNNVRFWNGKINAVQIYNRALTAAEVAQNFNALRGRYGI